MKPTIAQITAKLESLRWDLSYLTAEERAMLGPPPPRPPVTDEQARAMLETCLKGLRLGQALLRVEHLMATMEQVRIALAETLKDSEMHEYGPEAYLADFLDGWATHGEPNQPWELDECQIETILDIVPAQPEPDTE